MENRITFKIKTEYYLEFLRPETTTLIKSTISKTNKDENKENMNHLEIPEVVLIKCNIVNNDYQQHSRVLYTFVPNQSFGQLLHISLKIFISSKPFNSEFLYMELWLIDRNSISPRIKKK